MENVLLVDGSNLLFQMYYGMPARIVNAQGRLVHGTIGFLGALLKMIRWTTPTHVAVLFDGECANGRVHLDGDYKANREDYSQTPEEETPFSQLPDIYSALDYLGICHQETSDCEVDDWIAGYVFQFSLSHTITIVSQDSDYFQLIGDKVRVLRYRGEKSVICDQAWLRQKFGIEPSQYADYKSMVGDTADNIRGADKIGPKTSAMLLQEFGSLDNILTCVDRIQKPSIRESLTKNAPRLRLNQLLICLDGSHPFPFALEQMAYTDRGMTSVQVLKELKIL